MSIYQNVKVTHGSKTIASDATADIIDDGEKAKLWGLGTATLEKGATYLLSGGGALDWTGEVISVGKGTEASPYLLDVSDLAAHRAKHKHR
jgi:hypothetical protein